MKHLLVLGALMASSLFAQQTAQRWQIDANGALAPIGGRNVAIGTTCPAGSPAGSVCAAGAVASPALTVNVVSYGAVADVTTGTDGAITTGTATFTSAAAAFTTADVGKAIYIAGAGSAGKDLQVTIIAHNSATSVTLSGNASMTVTGATYRYGTINDTAFAAARTAAATRGGATIYIPGAEKCYGTVAAWDVTASNIRVTGDGDSSCIWNLSIDGATGDGNAVIALHNGGTMTANEVDHLFLRNSGTKYVSGDAGTALLSWSDPSTTYAYQRFHDLHFYTQNRDCITNSSLTADHYWIENNYFELCGENGIYMSAPSNYGEIRGNRFGGSVAGNLGVAIQVHAATSLEIDSNTINMAGYANGIQFAAFSSPRPRVTHNRIYGFDQTGSSGILYGFTQDGVIESNYIIGAIGSAISLNYSKTGPGTGGAIRTWVTGNQVITGSAWCISMSGDGGGNYASDAWIKANRCYQTTSGIQIDTAGGSGEVTGNEIIGSAGTNGLYVRPATAANWTVGPNSVSGYSTLTDFASGLASTAQLSPATFSQVIIDAASAGKLLYRKGGSNEWQVGLDSSNNYVGVNSSNLGETGFSFTGANDRFSIYEGLITNYNKHTTSLPTCDAGTRGLEITIYGDGATTPDVRSQCGLSAANVYSWQTIKSW